jgi:hypothetical protein
LFILASTQQIQPHIQYPILLLLAVQAVVRLLAAVAAVEGY